MQKGYVLKMDIFIKLSIICLLAFTSGILDAFLRSKGLNLTYAIFFLNGYFACLLSYAHFYIERK
jgi:hypothetical protein